MSQSNTKLEEHERLKSLHSYNILDTESEEDFNDIVELASDICGTPISLISLIDKDRQWFKARKGMSVQETSREVAFCNYAIKENKLFEIEDATKDERFANNPLVVGDPNIRYYAGFPLTTEEGYKLGTLCVLHKKPHQLNASQKKALQTLSKRVVNELELRRKISELNNLNVFKDKLLSILGHDLRSPLSAIDSVIQMIDQQILTESDIKKFRKLLRAEVNETLSLLDNILRWSTLYIQNTQSTFKKIDIKRVLQETFDLVQISLVNKKIKINDQSSHYSIYGDPEMIKLIFRNILNNAIKFSQQEGSIDITTLQDQAFVTITITDSGVGMTEEQIARILERKRSKSTPGTANEKGAGIGMLLTLEFLDMNNGKLAIKSQFEKGSSFIVTLPKAEKA